MKPITGFIITIILGCLAVGAFGVFANGAIQTNRLQVAQVTAQAFITPDAPLTGEEQLGIHGMDKIAEVAGEGFKSNVQIAASGDAAQASMAWSFSLAQCAIPASLLGAALLVWALKWDAGKKSKETHIE